MPDGRRQEAGGWNRIVLDFREIPALADGHVFVAERDGVIVGFAAVLPRPDGDAELDALFVEPSLWKGGVGRLLVEHCADVARGRASRILHVVGNPHAEGLLCRVRLPHYGSRRDSIRLGSRDAAWAWIASQSPHRCRVGPTDIRASRGADRIRLLTALQVRFHRRLRRGQRE